ncbi:MAG TPA: AprI/Inh family metalloprotease inhibitor [Xanthobacteraceae bacterium]|nr:AprI/Inh family metalloprotease inhibitor [Xanthobacteraceae bacterium]
MAGRWRLVSAGGQACNMTFTAASGDLQGAVAPEGGCPGKFFTTRHWNFDHDTLRLLDHKNEPLVELKRNSAGRFEGEAANNGLVWLEQ